MQSKNNLTFKIEVTLITIGVIIITIYCAFEVWIRKFAHAEELYYKASHYNLNENDFMAKLTARLAYRAGKKEALLLLARIEMHNENYKSAIFWYKIANEELSYKSDFFIAYCYQKLENYDKAIEWYKKSITNGDKAYGQLAELYFLLKKYDLAINYYKKAVAEKVNYANLGLGNVYKTLKQYDKALECYKQAVKTTPDAAYEQIIELFEEQNNPKEVEKWQKKWQKSEQSREIFMAQLKDKMQGSKEENHEQ